MSSTGSRPSFRGALLVTGALAFVAACGSSGGSTPGASTAATAGSTAPAASAPIAGGSTAPAVTTPAATTSGGGGGGTAAVDLTFTGTYTFTAKGTAGRCIIIKHPDGSASFGFEATEADYPGLGQSYSMAEFNGFADVKWVKDAATAWGNNINSKITLTPDHHGISIDQDLSPFTPQGGAPAGPEHVKGTITCP